MLHSPFFSTFSGIQEMQPHTQAAGLADLEEEGSQWGGWSGVGEAQRGGAVGGCSTVSRTQGSLAFCSSHHTGLTASWSQEGSQASDVWTQDVVGWPRQQDTRDDNEHSMISFCLSM